MESERQKLAKPEPYPGGDDSLAALREDTIAALRHLHFMSMQSKHDLIDVVSRLSALVEELLTNQHLDFQAFNERRLRQRQVEEERLQERAYVQVSNVEDKYQLDNLPVIDCPSLLHLCKARCCKLPFPLSFQDLEEGVVAWTYAAPYLIRQNSSGYCVHINNGTGSCGVYSHRPAACRQFDCRGNKQIWLDFERHIPAPMNEAMLNLNSEESPDQS